MQALSIEFLYLNVSGIFWGDSLIKSPPFRFHLGSTVIGPMNSSSDSINVGDKSLFHIILMGKKQKISYC